MHRHMYMYMYMRVYLYIYIYICTFLYVHSYLEPMGAGPWRPLRNFALRPQLLALCEKMVHSGQEAGQGMRCCLKTAPRGSKLPKCKVCRVLVPSELWLGVCLFMSGHLDT